MLKRLVYIALYTGLGQLISIYTLKYLSQSGHSNELIPIAEVDSLFFFILTLIALGLQPSAMRNLALKDDWKPEYEQTQSARITLGILLMSLSLLAFFNKFYLVFLISPIIALNGDYALYARGYSILGAFIAFLRLLIPFSLLILFAKLQSGNLVLVYIISLVAVYFLTNLYIALYLKTPFWANPKLKNLNLYLTSMPLGIVSLSLYIIGLGVLLFVPYFYNDAIVSTAFIGLKFYVLFKGILRIIHQAFLMEMTDDRVCLKVDQLSAIAGVLFAGTMLIFPFSFISLFFGDMLHTETAFFCLLSIAALIYSSYLSLATRSMLDKKDKAYTTITFIAALATIIIVIISSFISQSATSIAVSILLGELIWTIGLIRISTLNKSILERFIFIIQISALLSIPLLVRYLWKDNLPAYLVGFGLYAITLFILFHNKFSLNSQSRLT